MYVLAFGSIAILALIFVGPWFSILALNTLFGLAIPVNFWTWLSMLWIQALLVLRKTPTKE